MLRGKLVRKYIFFNLFIKFNKILMSCKFNKKNLKCLNCLNPLVTPQF